MVALFSEEHFARFPDPQPSVILAATTPLHLSAKDHQPLWKRVSRRWEIPQPPESRGSADSPRGEGGTPVATAVAMKIAIPVWNGRVSPVFDVARAIRVVDVDVGRGCVSEGSTHAVAARRPVSTLSALGVDALVCSAISPPIEAAVWVSGVEVISDICGSPDEILEALAAGDTELSRFRSPGSRRQRGLGKGKTPNQERRENGGHSVETR